MIGALVKADQVWVGEKAQLSHVILPRRCLFHSDEEIKKEGICRGQTSLCCSHCAQLLLFKYASPSAPLSANSAFYRHYRTTFMSWFLLRSPVYVCVEPRIATDARATARFEIAHYCPSVSDIKGRHTAALTPTKRRGLYFHVFLYPSS